MRVIRPVVWPPTAEALDTLREAVRCERAAGQRELVVAVTSSRMLQAGDALLLEVRYDGNRVVDRRGAAAEVTEEYDGGRAAHASTELDAEIVELDSDGHRFVLDAPVATILEPGVRLSLTPPDFLQALYTWVHRTEALPEEYRAPGHKTWRSSPQQNKLTTCSVLRQAQAKALHSARFPASVLWGPPGTGKTFTLGHVIAAHVQAGRRVLALSTTNAAIDLLVLATDDACRARGMQPKPAELLRLGMPPADSPLNRPDRKHLMAWTQVLEQYRSQLVQLAERLRILEAQRRREAPLGQVHVNDAPIAKIRQDITRIKHERKDYLKTLADQARCIATTTTSFLCNPILHVASHPDAVPFDVMVLDEASMIPAAVLPAVVSMAGARVLMLGGDFHQLPPIARATNSRAKLWFGTSVLDFALPDAARRSEAERCGSLVMLEEQSRMQPEICAAVSRAFYAGRLRTTGSPPMPPDLPGWPRAGIVLVDPNKASRLQLRNTMPHPTKRKSGSWYWDRSAQVARALVAALLHRHPLPQGIMVVSPFREQAKLLRNLVLPLAAEGLRVGTVHRMQGGEAEVVIYDPVQPGTWFLTTNPSAVALHNVAASRARAQLFVLSDPAVLRTNALLAKLSETAEVWVPEPGIWGSQS